MPVPMRAAFHNKAEAKYNVTTEFPSLGLHSAASTGNVGLVEYALNNGQPVNSVLDGVLPLHAACAGGNIQVVKVLIDHGADVNAPRLPRKYSIDKGRDSSTPIVGTSGSTPLHFAAANGNTEVVSLLLLHGAHADRPDKHGVTPEMLASQNGWVESARVLRDWIVNKDKDLRERAPGPSNGFRRHDTLESQVSSAPRRRLHVKQSIDTALNMLKNPDNHSTKIAQSLRTSSPAPPSPRKLGEEYTFYPMDQSSVSPIDPGSRRPSLPHILPSPPLEVPQRPGKLSKDPSTEQRRPSSAGTGADRRPEPEMMYPVYGRGGSGRKLGSKYSLLNIFKKGQSGDGSESAEISDPTAANMGSTVTLPLPSTQNYSEPSVVASNRAGIQHRGSDASSRSRIVHSPPSQQNNLPLLPRKVSGNLQTPPRANVPLAVEMHLALAQQQRAKSNSNGSQPGDFHGEDMERAKSSSPLAKLHAILHPGHHRHRSGSSSSMPAADTSAIDDEDALSNYNGTPDSENGKPSPSPRPGILRAHNRNPSSGQMGSPLNSRILRFDSSSSNPSNERKTDYSPRAAPGTLRSYNSAGSLTKMNIQTNAEDEAYSIHEHQVDNYSDVLLIGGDTGDQEEDYGKSIDGLESSVIGGPNVPSVLLQRQRGQSFASSSESSLSPILSNENGNDPTMAVLNADFPFSINRPPSLQDEETADDVMSSPAHLTVPISSETRNRGDSLSSTSTSDSRGSNLLMRSTGTSGSDTSVTVSSPGLPSLSTLGKDLTRSPEQSRSRAPPPLELVEDSAHALSVLSGTSHLGLNERRARGPLDIDITSISSHAQAEALVERARQEALDIASTSEISPPGSSVGRTPLSARLAAYGESLELERKLREGESLKERLYGATPSTTVSSTVNDATTPGLPRQQPREGVERQLSLENRAGPARSKKRVKDPRRPSTADGVTSNKQDMFIPDRTYSHHASRSTSTANYTSAPPTDDQNQYQSQNDHQVSSQDVASSNPDYGHRLHTQTHTPILPADESLSRINSSDGADTETDSGTMHHTSTTPTSVRGKREQVRTAKKLTRMGYPAAEQVAAAGRTAPPIPPSSGSKRFGLKTLYQTFKSRA